MLMAVVPRDQAENVVNALVVAGFTATITDGRGGVLRQAQRILFIVIAAEKLEEVLALIRTNCRVTVRIEDSNAPPDKNNVPTKVGGAVVFIWDIGRIETY